MYTYEQRKAAVKLYIKYYHKASAVIRELGYPDRRMLVKWFEEYESTGDLHQKSLRSEKYTEDQQIEQNLFKAEVAQAAAALFSK